jgi:1,3-beta-glucanosyltransferase GAS1
MSDIWSGGIAFNYFPAQSAAGQFGMVTVDGSTVTTSQDFDNLKEQYNKVSPPTTPTKSNAPAETYAACPAQSSDLLASTTLPPTPNDNACGCVESALSCVYKPTTNNETLNNMVIGELLDYSCSLLGQNGGSCAEISASGSSGTYGLVSSCDPGMSFLSPSLGSDYS